MRLTSDSAGSGWLVALGVLRPAGREDEVRHSSPPARQPPQPRRDQFHRIPGGVTKVKGFAAFRPLDFFFNDNSVVLQECPPGVERFGLNAQGEMARPGGSMNRQLVALQGG